MAWNLFEPSREGQIRIIKPFKEKYTVTLESDLTMASMQIKTVAETRYEMDVVKINENGYEMIINTLESTLLSTNNPNIKELMAFNNVFKRMYNELHLQISFEGAVLKIYNLPLIQKKWGQVKAEMRDMQARHKQLESIVTLNDDIFNNIENIKTAIRSLEFFEVFFHFFLGRKANPAWGVKGQRKSIFMQGNINFNYNYSTIPALPTVEKHYQMSFDITATDSHDKGWVKEMYGGFPIISDVIKDMRPVIKDKGQYLFDTATGKILKATFEKAEDAHPQYLHGRMKFTIAADTYKAAATAPKKDAAAQPIVPKRSPNDTFNTLFDENELTAQQHGK